MARFVECHIWLHVRNMAKSKEWCKKLSEVIIAFHKQGTWYKKIAKALNVPRDTDVQGSVQKKSWKILQWSSQSLDLNPIENLLWDLKATVAAHTPKNISELEAIAHEEWTKIPQKRCQKQVSGYTSCLQQVMTAKRCSTKY